MDHWVTPVDHHVRVGMCGHSCTIIVAHASIILLAISAFIYCQRVARKRTLVTSSLQPFPQEIIQEIERKVEPTRRLPVVEEVPPKQADPGTLSKFAVTTVSEIRAAKAEEADLHVSVQPFTATPDQSQSPMSATYPGLPRHAFDDLLDSVQHDSGNGQDSRRDDSVPGGHVALPHKLISHSAVEDSLLQGLTSTLGPAPTAASTFQVVNSVPLNATEALAAHARSLGSDASAAELATAGSESALLQAAGLQSAELESAASAATQDSGPSETKVAKETAAASKEALISRPLLALQDLRRSGTKGALKFMFSNSKRNMLQGLGLAVGDPTVSRGENIAGNVYNVGGEMLDSMSAWDSAPPEWESLYGAITPELFQQRRIEARDYTISLVCILGSLAITLPLIRQAGMAQKFGTDSCFAVMAVIVFLASTIAKLLHTAGLQQRSVFVVKHRNVLWVFRFLVLHPLRNYLFHAAGFEVIGWGVWVSWWGGAMARYCTPQ